MDPSTENSLLEILSLKSMQKYTPYQQVVLISKRAKQIMVQQRADFTKTLDQIVVEEEDPSQLVEKCSEVACKFEKGKPLLKAAFELSNGYIEAAQNDLGGSLKQSSNYFQSL